MDGWLKALLDSFELLVFVGLLAAGYFRGRVNERRHLADLDRRERELRHVLIFAGRYPPALDGPHDPVLVTGSVAIAGDFFRSFVAGLRKLVGGRFAGFETLVSRTRREAILRLKAQALAAGCTMVFNVRVETRQIQNGARGDGNAVEVLACGTAFAPALGSVEASPHRFVPGPLTPGTEVFGLEKNRASRFALIAMGVTGAVVLAEAFGLQRDTYTGASPWWLRSLLGCGVAVAGFRWLRRGGVPWLESSFTAAMAVFLSALLFHYGALHVNALTARPIDVAYRLQADHTLVAQGYPMLSLPDDHEFWWAQVLGSEHRFTLRRGVLGFWQYDQDAYHDRLHIFYWSR